MRKYQDCVTGAWKQISKQRRRNDESSDSSIVLVMALQPGTWMDDDIVKKIYVRGEEQRRSVRQPFYCE